MNKIIIIGATSGIGYAMAEQLLAEGYILGLAGRHIDRLEKLSGEYPKTCYLKRLDITKDDATIEIDTLITEMGGVDTFIHCSGIGWGNVDLEPELELKTVKTNVEGLIRTTTHIFNFFRKTGGHIVVISSIAGTKILGSAPAYSASKRFQNAYVDGLVQLATISKCKIKFTDIRPGFVDTPLIEGQNYPMKMSSDYCAKHIIKAIKRKKRISIIDWRYRLLVMLWKLIPQYIWERLSIK